MFLSLSLSQLLAHGPSVSGSQCIFSLLSDGMGPLLLRLQRLGTVTRGECAACNCLTCRHSLCLCSKCNRGYLDAFKSANNVGGVPAPSLAVSVWKGSIGEVSTELRNIKGFLLSTRQRISSSAGRNAAAPRRRNLCGHRRRTLKCCLGQTGALGARRSCY